ncbi:MAG: hypothetical protein KA004_08765 [Verrucomicrobiales bacterium]|nr:hypothetical protein [Verrucomicrobiales bacterium]
MNPRGKKISNRLWPLLLAGGVISCGLASCQSAKPDAGSDEPLVVQPPETRRVTPRKGEGGAEERVQEKWTSISRSDGTHYVLAKDGMDDVVSLYANQSAADPGIKTLDDVENLVRGGEGLKFEKLRRAEVLGVPVLRFERLEEDSSGGDDRVRAALGTRGRTLATTYFIRTVGALVMHPKNPNRFVTIGCARASHHGELGEYSTVFEDFLAAFVADNCLEQQTWH